MNRTRLLKTAGPLLVVAALSVAPAYATMAGKHANACKSIDAALASGKTPTEVAKELKVSKKSVSHCQQAMASAANPSRTHKTQTQ
jgi:DNA-directed RNA polymerase specialized sigma subunit